MAPSTSRCPNCSSDLSPDGFCLRCALTGVVTEEAPEESTVPTFTGYELLEEIGQDGAMGAVYKARDAAGRVVALKMLRADRLRSVEVIRRFQIEVEASANLDHPHVLPIYEVGEHHGQHYYTMKLATGGSLARQHLDGRWRVSCKDHRLAREQQREIARLLKAVAEGVQHAHERSVLHRDLKPGNILLDEEGTPYVSDFGLAKQLNTDSDLTRTQGMVGTPAYMAPEQTEEGGKHVTARTDVWALGAILYELLTGRVPFDGADPFLLLDQVRNTNPIAPRRINPAIDQDLEIICLRCLEKLPSQRLPTANELAEELGRFLRHEPIRSRPVGWLQQLWKWCQRKPAIASLAAGMSLLMVGWVGWEMLRAAQTRQANRILSLQAADNSLTDGRIEGFNILTQLLTQSPDDPLPQYRAQSAMSYRTWASEILRTNINHSYVTAMEVSPDGKWWASASADGAIRIVGTESLQEVQRLEIGIRPGGLSISPSADTVLAFGRTNRLACLQRNSSANWVVAWQRELPRTITWVAPLPNGRAVIGDDGGGVSQIDLASAELIWYTPPEKGQAEIKAGEISPLGDTLATGDINGNLAILRLRDGAVLKRTSLVELTDGNINDLHFDAVSGHLWAAPESPQLIEWSWTNDMKVVRPVPEPIRQFVHFGTHGWILGLVDGRLLRLGQVGNNTTIEELGIKPGGPPRSLRSTGEIVALLNVAGEVHVFNAATGNLLTEKVQLRPGVSAMALSGQPRLLLTAGLNSDPAGSSAEGPSGVLQAMTWSSPLLDASGIVHRAMAPTNINCVAVSPNGLWEASGGEEGVVWFHARQDATTGFRQSFDGPIQSVAFTPDSGRLLVGCYSGRSAVIALGGSESPRTAFGPDKGVWGFKPVETLGGVVTLTRTGANLESTIAEWWRLEDPTHSTPLKVTAAGGEVVTPRVGQVATARRGSTLLGIGDQDFHLYWWDAHEPAKPGVDVRTTFSPYCCALDSSGATALIGANNGVLTWWRRGESQPVRSLTMAPINAVVVSPNRSVGYAGLVDGRIYEIPFQGKPRLVGRLRGMVTDVVVSDDDGFLAAATSLGEIKAWHTQDCLPVSELWEVRSRVDRLAFAPDASTLLAACRDGTTRSYQVRWPTQSFDLDLMRKIMSPHLENLQHGEKLE